jgi:antitoxin ChpS
MHTTNLRRVGGSIMMVVPPAVLDMLHLQAGSTVGVVVDGGRLVVEPQKRKPITYAEMVAECDPDAPLPDDRDWVDAPDVGREIISND